MDRRIQKTRVAIFTAFESLLRKKLYSQITVQDITDEANIGRSTFYSHFETKDELLNSICSEMFIHIFEEHSAKESSHDFSFNSDLSSIITHILYHLKDEKTNCKGLLSCDEFWEYFNNYFSNWITKYLQENDNFKDIFVPKEYVIKHLSYTFIEISKWWISNKLKETPEEISLYYETITSNLITYNKK